MPHKCRIQYRTRANDVRMGNVETRVTQQSNVPCWEQQLSSTEISDYEKRGISADRKIYFLSDPNVTERYEIVITERNDVEIEEADEQIMDVSTRAEPDASVGLELLYRIACNLTLSASQ